MRIMKGQVVAGADAKLLRKAFQRADHWGDKELASYVGLGDDLDLARRLVSEGYLESVRGPSRMVYRTTLKARALALATARRPIKRQTAEKLLGEFLDRVDRANSSPNYLYSVTRVVVFGSFLDDCEVLGDIDLAIGLEPRAVDGEGMVEAILAYADEASRKGRKFAGFMERLNWPTEDILRALKGRSRSISIHLLTDGVLESAAQRVVFPR